MIRPSGRSLQVFIFLLLVGGGGVYAAEFDIHGPTVELRRLQICVGCGQTLAVTSVAPGAAIRCPHCDTLQKRLPTRLLLNRVYQVCPKCGARMDVQHLRPLQQIRCGTCGYYQYVLPEAVFPQKRGEGRGIPPPAISVPAARKEFSEISTSTPSPPHSPFPRSIPSDENRLRVDRIEKEKGESSPSSPSEGGSFPPSSSDTQRPPSPPENLPSIASKEAVPTEPKLEVSNSALETVSSKVPPLTEEGLRLAAKVNGRPILKAEVYAALRIAIDRLRLRLGSQAGTREGEVFLREQREKLYPEVLESLIRRELLFDLAEREGMMPTEREILAKIEEIPFEERRGRDRNDLLTEARFRLVWERLRSRYAPSVGEIAPSTIRARYEEKKNHLHRPAQTAIVGLVVYKVREGREDRRQAIEIVQEIQRRLEQGEDFLRLISAYSEGPFAKSGERIPPEPGKTIPIEMLAPPLQAAIQKIGPGIVVGPIELSAVWAFARAEVLAKDAPVPFEEVAPAIEQELRAEAKDRAFETWIAGLRSRAQVEIF